MDLEPLDIPIRAEGEAEFFFLRDHYVKIKLLRGICKKYKIYFWIQGILWNFGPCRMEKDIQFLRGFNSKIMDIET